MVPKGSVIAEIDGVLNAVAVDSDMMGLTLVGPGAGGDATSSAVVAHIVDLSPGRKGFPFGRPGAKLGKLSRAPMQRPAGGYYIPLPPLPRPRPPPPLPPPRAPEKI